MKLAWRDVKPGNGPAINTSLTEREAAELARLAAGREVLEIGSAYGYSAVVMALGGATHVTAVDPHAWLASRDAMELNLRAYGVEDRVTIVQADSRAALPALAEQGRRYDLIWIDGDHAAEVVAHDVRQAVKLLRPDAVLACHDYDEATCPGVRQALDAWRIPERLVDTMAVYEHLVEVAP